jgi:DNA-binding IclR family transcriptional regulator
MHALSRDVEETVQICGRDGDHMVVVAMSEGPGHFRVTSRIGTRVPLNWTASGRLLVGHLPADERLALFRRSAQRSPTGRAETNAAVLSAAAAEAFAERLSIQISESDFSVACVAAPIRDQTDSCIATISIVLPEPKAAQAQDRYAGAVRAAAARIEAALGRA